MLSRAAQERLVIVLVGARNPQNIGAAARAIQDFGFHHLRVVNEYALAFETAQTEATSAVGAGEVMRQAHRFAALPEAIADCSLVAGTTAVGGRNLRQPVLPLREAAASIVAALELASAIARQEDSDGQRRSTSPEVTFDETPEVTTVRVALLFGSEKSGLTKEQLSFCSLLLTIPLFAPEGRHLSMNLGQSVAVCLYELTRQGFEGARSLPAMQEAGAVSADRERLLDLLQEVMRRSGYARRFPSSARVEVVRHLVQRLGTTRNEAATWTGLLRMILKHLPQTEPSEAIGTDSPT